MKSNIFSIIMHTEKHLKKRICTLILTTLACFTVFCHEAQKQTVGLNAEPVTEKWLDCETELVSYSSAESDSGAYIYNEYLKRLASFCEELQKAKPDDIVIYYFPEADGIYQGLKVSSSELIDITKSAESISFLMTSPRVSILRRRINTGVSDWEILQKSVTKFQLEQLYYSYRILIAVIFVLCFLTLLLFVMYLFISKSRKENKVFTRHMLLAQEAERERISNELHDTVCQDLRVLQFNLKDSESIDLCRKIASDVRNTCYALTPSDLNEGILEAIISLCELFRKHNELNLILSIQDDIKNNGAYKKFSRDKSLNIYRIVQEILTNAVKHSGANTVSVLIRSFDENNFRIIISDDGKGFDIKNAFKKKKHFGLKSIRTRVEALYGDISFYSEPDDGTQVTVTIPY